MEKIKNIKEYCTVQNIDRHECFIDDEYKICSLLPDVELFKADYGLKENSFPSIGEADNVKSIIKAYKADNGITQNVKEKNNFEVFEAMTQAEWQETVEDTLISFLQEIVE